MSICPLRRWPQCRRGFVRTLLLGTMLLITTGLRAQPLPPLDLTATLTEGPAVELTWTNPQTATDGIEIERAPVGGAWTVVHTAAPDANSWTDTTITPGVALMYRARTFVADVIRSDLPVPTNFRADADERVVRLRWDRFPHWQTGRPDGVEGYLVRWGPAGSDLSATRLTREPLVQLEPLLPGQTYEAVVRALDRDGRASLPSPRFAFAPDPTRINGLRARMNGFFDDFDLPAGPPDERKWNFAWSANNDPARNGAFITSRNHIHTTVSAYHSDRSQAIARARTPFDFTDRTGEIVFDFDGAERRDHWYLDLVPRRTDITGHINAMGPGVGHPLNTLRYRQNGGKVEVVWIGATGEEQVIADSGWSLSAHGVQLVKHVRQPWRIALSRTHTIVWINERKVVEAALDLPWERCSVHFAWFSYNTPKANFALTMADWDNFGFDAAPDAPPPPVVHNYVPPRADGTEYLRLFDHEPKTVTVRLPDSLAGATAARLMFTMQMMPHDRYAWSADDRVTLSDRTLAVPEPRDGHLVGGDLVSVLKPYTVVLDLDPAWLVTGDNALTFAMARSGALNIHIEVDFPAGAAPAYTPPHEVYPDDPRPVPPEWPIGPGVRLAEVNGEPTWPYLSGSYTPPETPHRTVSGTATFDVVLNEDAYVNGNGVYVGITRVEMLVNDVVVETRRTDAYTATTGGTHTFTLDTTAYPDGEYRVAFRAWNTPGHPSHPDHFDGSGQTGALHPVHLQFANGL